MTTKLPKKLLKRLIKIKIIFAPVEKSNRGLFIETKDIEKIRNLSIINVMKNVYLAPMEGLTTRIFRQAFGRHYKGVDKCFTPFLSPNQNKSFQKREYEEICCREENLIYTVPQLICCNADHFVWAASEIAAMGYEEINFNLGCPSGTVVSKKKGSGFLSFSEELDSFFDAVFPEMERLNLRLSVKTRLGRYSCEEFEKILDIYNKYPICEIIVHPRVQKDFYREPVKREWYEYAVEKSVNPIVYNGDIFTAEDLNDFEKRYPEAETVMLGRALIGRPFLLADKSDTPADMNKLRSFHDDVLEGYRAKCDEFSVLCKMKELWEHMGPALNVSDGDYKKIRKSKTVNEYKLNTERVWHNE